MPSSNKSSEPSALRKRAFGFFHDVRSVTVTRVATLLMSFGASIVLARALGPEDRGLLTAIILIPVLVASVAEAGVRQASAFYIAKQTFSDSESLGAIVSLFFALSALGFVVCLGILKNFGFEDVSNPTLLLASAIVPFMLIRSFSSGVFLGKRQIVKFNRTFWIPEFIRLALLIGLAMSVGLSVMFSIMAQLISLALICGYGVYLLLDLMGSQFQCRWSVTKTFLQMGLGFGITLFLVVLNYKIGTLILHGFSTSTEVGYFAIALSLAELVFQIPTIINSLLFQRSAARTAGVEFSRKVTALMRLTVIVASAVAVGLMAISPFFIPIAFGEDFAPSIPVLAALLPGMAVMCIFKILAIEVGALGKPWWSLAATLPCIIVNLVLGALLAPSLGAIGAAIATSVAYFLTSVIYCVIYSRVMGIGMSDILIPRKSDFTLLTERIPGLSSFISNQFGKKER